MALQSYFFTSHDMALQSVANELLHAKSLTLNENIDSKLRIINMLKGYYKYFSYWVVI